METMKKQSFLWLLTLVLFGGSFISWAEPPKNVPTEPTASDGTMRTGTSRVGSGFALGIDGGYMWSGGLNTNLTDNTSGNTVKSSGSDIDADSGSIGADARYYFGVVPFLQNNIRPPAFCGVWGRYNVDNSNTGLNLNLHPTTGVDTRLTLERNGFLMPYCGLGLFSIQQVALISFYLGARFEFIELIGKTDETGGGGRLEEFNRTRTNVSPTLGLEGEIPLSINNVIRGPKPFFYAGFAGDHFPEENVTGMSSNNFNYDFEVESGWNARGYAGARFHF